MEVTTLETIELTFSLSNGETEKTTAYVVNTPEELEALFAAVVADNENNA